jgi:LPXTG-motif cell wall-anchored protein
MMRISLRHLVSAAGLLAMGFTLVGPGGVSAQEPPADTQTTDAVPCVWVDALVVRGNATFTIGPAGCDGEVGPISFSAFELPDGNRLPLESQVLIAHHPDNGASYSEGLHSLTLDIGAPCNWQTDLYLGNSTAPVYGDMVMAADYLEGQVCEDETTTTTTTTEATEVDSGGPVTTDVGQAGGATTTTVTTSAPTTTTATTTARTPTTTQSVGGAGGTLPQTGPNETLMVSLLGGALVGLGALARRVART